MHAFSAADPFVLRVDNTYYLYVTSDDNRTFLVRSSQDLEHWSQPKIAFRASEDSWMKDCFWAPECHCIRGRYYLFFSTNQKDSKEEESFAITRVVSDTPDGPFTDDLKRPLFVEDYPAIDGNIHVDGDRVILYFSRCCYKHVVDGLEESWIYAAELNEELTGLKTRPRLLLRPEQEWEGRSVPTTGRRWNEGSFILKEADTYYMIYSANCYLERYYAMGYAVAKDPFGPFVKADENPIVECTDAITGTGHGCLVRTANGMVAVYHGRTEATGELRIGFFAPAKLENGHLSIDFRAATMMVES